MGMTLMFAGILIAGWGAVSFARAAMHAVRARPVSQSAGTIWPGPM